MPRFYSFTIPPRPSSPLCNDAFISPYPHRCRAHRVCPLRQSSSSFSTSQYSALSVRMHRVQPRLSTSEPRSLPVSPSRCIHLFSLLSCSSLHHSLRLPLSLFLCPSFPSVPTSISNCVSLGFPYLHCVSSRWLTLRAVPVSASPATLCRSLYALFYLDRCFVRPAYLPRGLLPSLSLYVKLLEFFPV